MRLAFAPYKLQFKEPAGTSRGILHSKSTYFLKIWDERDPSVFGIGEAAVFPGLSREAGPGYEYKLVETLANIAIGRGTDLTQFPSIQFGLEQAIKDFSAGGKRVYFHSPFIQGEKGITINGLVWMGDIDRMMQRLEQKITDGFKCIKLKIGAISFADELKMLAAIRSRYSASELEIRVDANGAFTMDNVLPALHALSTYGVHSVEQPIAAGQWELTHFLTEVSKVPIVLDEELIGLNTIEQKEEMLEHVKPSYIVLKPALCGGFSGAQEWIDLAEARGIGWWVTSALESNIGLSALAQWVATLDTSMPQGLGTGQLFTNNFPSPLRLESDRLYHISGMRQYDNDIFNTLDWRE